MKKRAKLHFRRFEFKYLLPSNIADLIMPQLLSYMRLDPYAHKAGYYDVNSIYFDTPTLDFYQEKIDGIDPRRKFRLRFYGKNTNITSDDATVFFEIKRRFGSIVVKDREIIKMPHVKSSYWKGDILDKHSPGKVEKEVQAAIISSNLKPQISVNYKRIPFIAQYDSQVRVTLDSNIVAQNWSDTLLNAKHWHHLYPHLVVMELKCNNTIPDWFRDVIHRYSLERVSYSKFAISLNEVRNLGDYFTLE